MLFARINSIDIGLSVFQGGGGGILLDYLSYETL